MSSENRHTPVRSFRDLVAWQRALALARAAYGVADELPDYEKFALASQIRRAATSVYGNIAEGYGAGTRPRFLNHLRMARGSLTELQAHLGFVQELGSPAVPVSTLELLAETGRVLQGLIASIEESETRAPGVLSRGGPA